MVRVLWRSDKDKIAFKVTEKHRYGLPKTVSKYLKIWKTKTTTIKKNVIVAVTRSPVRQRVLGYSLLLPSNILSDWIEKQITSCPKLGFSFEIAWLKSFCLKAPISSFHNVCFYCTTEKYTLNELLLISALMFWIIQLLWLGCGFMLLIIHEVISFFWWFPYYMWLSRRFWGSGW